MSKKFCVTTPIYYVNDAPHIGHSYTTIAADVLSRYYRAEGRDVHFLTGTDEHGIKIVKAAAEKGISPKDLADQVVVHFQDQWQLLNIRHDDFIRTTQPRHEKRVQELIRRMLAAGQVYLGAYQGWYDEGQEEFVTESTARENEYKSAINDKPLVRFSEPSYFFRLSQWADKLREHILSHPEFIQPQSRRNEVLSKLAGGLEDLSISRHRQKLDWGVAMPNDENHVVYVWIDALSNYYTALGLPEVGDEYDGRYARFWPCDLHLIGKDILWFHAVYWPCMLLSLNLPLPRTVYAHGWWTSEGKKMSKSLGNFVSREVIAELCNEYHRDAFRYFVLREVPFGADGDFSRAAFQLRYNTDLANDVGNLLSRTVNMIGRYFDGAVPPTQQQTLPTPTSGRVRQLDGLEAQFLEKPLARLHEQAGAMMAQCSFNEYLKAVTDLATATNQYIDATSPFSLAKDPSQKDRLGTILYTCAEAVRIVLSYLEPVMPEKASAGLEQLGVRSDETPLSHRVRWGVLEPGTPTAKLGPLFPRKS